MRIILSCAIMAVLASSLTSCAIGKRFPYFEDLSDTSKVHIMDLLPKEPIILQQDDQLVINISSVNPSASSYFNAEGGKAPAGYRINDKGIITVPFLGDIQAKGLTLEQLKETLLDSLSQYLKNPIVSVKLANFKVIVLGEVISPREVTLDAERANILQVLGAAGDLTEFAMRHNIKVMRKNGDKLMVGHINLNSSQAFKSEFFQLKQNDIVYVEPYRQKGLKNETLLVFTPILLSVLSTISLLILRFSR